MAALARVTLVKALSSAAGEPQRWKAGQLLEYVSEFFGSCILECKHPWTRTQAHRSERVHQLALLRREPFPDREHKVVLLLEDFSRYGAEQVGVAAW